MRWCELVDYILKMPLVCLFILPFSDLWGFLNLIQSLSGSRGGSAASELNVAAVACGEVESLRFWSILQCLREQ